MAIRQSGLNFLSSPWLTTATIVGFVLFALVIFVVLAKFLNRKPEQNFDPGNPGVPNVMNRGCSIIFGGIFALAGFGLLFAMTIRPIYRSVRAGYWPTVPGVVVSSGIAERRDSDGDRTTRVDIRYRYVVNGRTLDGDIYDSSGKSTSNVYKKHKQAIVRGHPPGQAVTVYYDPADPTDAMLSTALPDGTIAFVWFPLLFIGVGLAAAMFEPKFANLRGTGQPVAAKVTPIAASEISADTTRRKRYGQAVGISVFAVIWNAFVIAFYFAIDGSWCIIPFALIGVAIIVFAVYSGLQLLNPAISVHFARMPMRPGDSTNVSFALAGNLFAVRQLTFTLEGREKVTYRQGTDTRTEEHVAWRIPCYETTRHVDMESGRFTIDLPADAMTTFIANNNQFTWHLICHGDVPGRPDIKDEFDVTVLPRDPSKREAR